VIARLIATGVRVTGNSLILFSLHSYLPTLGHFDNRSLDRNPGTRLPVQLPARNVDFACQLLARHSPAMAPLAAIPPFIGSCFSSAPA